MISLVKNLKCISRQNIDYYPNCSHKSSITSLKAAMVGKSLSSVFRFFMIKYSRFTNNIGSGSFADTFYQNNDKFQLPHTPLHLTHRYRHVATKPSW